MLMYAIWHEVCFAHVVCQRSSVHSGRLCCSKHYAFQKTLARLNQDRLIIIDLKSVQETSKVSLVCLCDVFSYKNIGQSANLTSCESVVDRELWASCQQKCTEFDSQVSNIRPKWLQNIVFGSAVEFLGS